MIPKLLQKTKEQIEDWITNRAHSRSAKIWLFIFSFTESSFFIIPPDVFLLAILINNGTRWVYYASLTTIASVFGGLLGYLIGFAFFDLIGQFIINTYHLQSQMIVVSEMFSNNAFWTIFISAFTPIPFKVFTISAGFFKINLGVFIIASTIGRGMRFFVVGYIVKLFGKQMARNVFKYFNWILLGIVAVLALIIFW